MDEFIDVIGYEGLYKINENGDVYSIKNKKILKPHLDYKGYFRIGLCKNSKTKFYRIHRLIAINFITNDDETKTQVDHIDGIRINNNISNLRWVTQLENSRNVVCNSDHIYETINKDRNNVLTFIAYYSVYINNKRIRKRKSSYDRNIVEEWLEQMKKEYPNQYTAGRI